MKRGWNRWQLGFGLLLLAAPAWGETLPVESPSSVLNPPAQERIEAESAISTPIPVADTQCLVNTTSGLVPDCCCNATVITPPAPLIKGGDISSVAAVQEKSVNPGTNTLIKGGGISSVVAVRQNGLMLSGNNIAAEETLLSQTEPTPQPQATPNTPAQQLDLSPEIIENSPVLQRWLRQVPNVLEEIRNEPSFRTRLRLGYSQFPSTGQAAGFNVGVEDVFIGRSGLTVSGDYQRSFNGDRESFGTDLRYYVLPLGGYVNVAPQVGYRNLTTGNFSTDGVNVGARLMLALSRTGAADASLTQSFVSPGSNDEVGITTLSFGYAVTRNLRVSTDIQKQNSKEDKDSRVGIVLEWMP